MIPNDTGGRCDKLKSTVNVEKTLDSYNIKPDLILGQHFLVNNDLLQQIVGWAEVGVKDTVLEVGAGVGNLTQILAARANRVIAYEIDSRFAPALDKLPANVEIRLDDAWSFIQLGGKHWKRREFNKVVANLPYTLCEPLLHNLTFLIYDKVLLMVPVSFLSKIDHGPIFSNFFSYVVKAEVAADQFYPAPRTSSVVIDLIPHPDAIATQNLPRFLCQYMYQHEEQLVKNSLREGLIHYDRLVSGRTLTKNQARRIIDHTGIRDDYLTRIPDSAEPYRLVNEFGDQWEAVLNFIVGDDKIQS